MKKNRKQHTASSKTMKSSKTKFVSQHVNGQIGQRINQKYASEYHAYILHICV